MRRMAVSPVALLGVAAILAGCAQTPLGPTVQVMPGPGKSFDAFTTDNNSCKNFAAGQVAGQADQANQRALAIGVLSTAVGAATGAAFAGGNGAAAGAGAGTALGTGLGAADNANSQFAIQQQYDAAFSQCMYAKGNNVPGFAPVVAMGSASMADPQVRAIQRELIRLGYMSGGADGILGPHTSSAISSFESSAGMSVDGSPSSQLLAALRSTPGSASARRAAPAAAASAPASTSSANWVAPVGATPVSTPASASSGSAGWVAPVSSP